MSLWKAHPGPQTDFLRRPADELFYGGPAGGGKSDALLAEAVRDVKTPGYRAPRVHRRCMHLLAELQGGYQYAPGNATHDHETPLDRDNHGVDALRYWAWMRARRT